MREIKFRAWDEASEEYLYSDTFPSMWQFFKELEHRGLRHWQVEEFTGLKDKNGKEIYEGDIVQEYQMRFDDKDEWVLSPYDKPDIVTMERFPVYWLQREAFGYEGEDLKSPDDFEVIGNIYENKELIGK